MNTAAANAAVLVFIIGLAVLLAMMLTAVYRTPEWQASAVESGGGPLPSVPAQSAPQAATGSLFSPPGAAAQPAADEANWAGVGARSGEGGGLSEGAGLGAAARMGQSGFLGEAGRQDETAAEQTDPDFASRHDPEFLEQATVGRLVVPGSPPWGPAPKPPGVL